MADDCCNKLMKYLLITINLVFFIAGLCLAGIGELVITSHNRSGTTAPQLRIPCLFRPNGADLPAQ